MKMVPLGECVTVSGGGTPRKANSDFYGGGIPWVTPKDMKQARISETQVTLTETGVSASPAKLVPAGSTILVVRSGVLKHTLPVALNSTPATLNQDMKALSPSSLIDSEYLFRLVKHLEPVVLGWVRATTADNFPIQNLLNHSIPLPPLDEQRRIAAILDKADAIRQKRRQAIAHLDTLTQSIFHEMFGQIEESVPFADLVDEFRYGTSNKSADTGYPALRIPNVVQGRLNLEALKSVPVTEAELNRLKLEHGDLLFVRTNGNSAHVGRCAMFDADVTRNSKYSHEPWIYASYLIRARLKSGYLPQFLSAHFSTAPARRALRKSAKTSAGQFNLNIQGLSSVRVPAADRTAQTIFVQKSEAIRQHSNGLKNQLANAEAVFSSLQSRAFQGEL